MKATLREKQSDFVRLVARLIDEATALGFELTFGEAYRTPEQAALNAKKGIGIKNSLHTKRLAIDLNLFRNGVLLTRTQDFALLGDWWEDQSAGEIVCAWGGRFGDGNHFSVEHEGVR